MSIYGVKGYTVEPIKSVDLCWILTWKATYEYYVTCYQKRNEISNLLLSFQSLDVKVIGYIVYKKKYIVMFKSCLDFKCNKYWRNREYVYSVAVYQKYLTSLGESIIFEPLQENYHFSRPI